MKKKSIVLIFVLFAILSSYYAQAQPNVDIKINMDTVLVKKFKPEWNDRIYLNFAYGDYHIINEKMVHKLKGKTIKSVELIYTDNPKGTDLKLLTRKRLAYLYLLMPDIFQNTYITWKLVKQTGAVNDSLASTYYHGFCITYRDQPSVFSELSYLKDVLSGKAKFQDSTILKVFNRHKNWKDMLIVVDVTGSMAPYTAQMLVWMKMMSKDKRVKKILFFNDDEENSKAKIDLTDRKGIAFTGMEDFEKTLKVCAKTMEEGGCIENYIEAILIGLKECPDCQDVVVISDNWESPCDMNFLKEIKKPIKVVLCGVQGFINLEHLEVAMSTKGSLHLMEQDLDDLYKLNEGQEIDILGMKFKVENGKLRRVKN